jgi:SET domain-containing protein
MSNKKNKNKKDNKSDSDSDNNNNPKEKYYHNSNFNLYLKESQIPNSGLGVYTKDIIPANTRIDEYLGDIMENWGGSYVLCVNDFHCIDAFNFPRCYMAMINDASHVTKKIVKKRKKKIDLTPDAYYDANGVMLTNNCEFVFEKNRGFIHSLREIKPDEELFISYGKDYWK